MKMEAKYGEMDTWTRDWRHGRMDTWTHGGTDMETRKYNIGKFLRLRQKIKRVTEAHVIFLNPFTNRLLIVQKTNADPQHC